MQVWATAWNVLCRTPSQVGRGGWAAVNFEVGLKLGGLLSVLVLVFDEARLREGRDRGRFLPLGQKSLFMPGCVQGVIIS